MGRVFDFRPFEGMYREWEHQFRSGAGPGEFSYAIGGPTSLYGSADMAISRAVMGILTEDEAERDAWSGVINDFQRRRSGWYRKRYTLHFRSHSAAYAIAALRLLDRKPRYSVGKAFRVGRSKAATERWLRRIPWSIVWPGSHTVAGMPAIRMMTDGDHGEFLDAWQEWLDAHVHPDTGFWSRGILQRSGAKECLTNEEMGGAFHMYFVYEFAGRRWPLPEKVVDATLELQHSNGLWDEDVPYCIDLDGVYCLTRSSRNAGGYRAQDIKAACRRFLAAAESRLNDRDFLFRRYDNSHRLTGALSAVAECAKFYGDAVKTQRPWEQTLDRAPYI